MKYLCVGKRIVDQSINQNFYSHLDPLHLDPPGVGGLVQRGLHPVGDLLPLRQDLSQALRTQHVPNNIQ